VVGLLLWCCLPGIALATRWSLTTQVIVAEKTGPAAGLARSWNLVAGRFRPVLGTMVLTFLMVFTPRLIRSGIDGFWLLPPTPGSFEAPEQISPHRFGSIVLENLVIVLTSSYAAVAFTLLYYDLRIRKEAFDLERMIAALEPSSSSRSQLDNLEPPDNGAPRDTFGLPPPE